MNETNLIEDLRLLSPPSYGWVLGGAAVVVCGVILLLVLWRRAQHAAVPTAAPDAGLSPWDAALAELEGLSPLLRTDRSRDYGRAATAILRRYLEARYGLHAPRQTTEEFLVAAAASPALRAEDRLNLGRFLAQCDLCKFGRFVATVEELQELQAAAVALVLGSRPANPAVLTASTADEPG
jgi:hypothetical protein